MSNRILLVTGNFPPEIGGPATFIDALARHLTSAGERVTVLCSSQMKADDRARGYRVVRIPMNNRYLFEARVRIALASEFVLHQKILVNTLDEYLTPITAFIKKPFIAKVVGDFAWERGRNLGIVAEGIDQFQKMHNVPPQLAQIQERRRRYLTRAAWVVTPGYYLSKLVSGWQVPKDRIKVIPNGCPELSVKWPRAQPCRNGRLRVIFVGRFTNWKGIETLLLAAARSPEVQVVLCGSGPLYPLIVQLIQQLNLGDRIKLLGKLSREAVVSEIARSQALVLPSLYEGLSHTLLDGLKVGIPIIASDIGGNREVITHEKEGVLVSPLNVAELTTAFSRIRDSWDKFAQQSYLRSEEFSFETCASEYHRLLCE